MIPLDFSYLWILSFKAILNLFACSGVNITLDFTFATSCLAKIKKISNETLNKKKHIQSRIYSFKNFLKQIKIKIIKN